MIHLITDTATSTQLRDMLAEYNSMIKIAVDIRQAVLAGGGEMHVDCEQVLLENGSEQDDIWGANWYPAEQRIEFEALINIRPRQNNRSIVIQDEELRSKIEKVTRALLGGVHDQ
jgi:hypothetical protein